MIMKKFTAFFAMLFAAVALCGMFGSCKKETEPGGVKADKFAGTYRLAAMSAEINGENIDLMKTRGIDEFLVIGKEGTGFLSHEQTDGKFTCRVVKLEFIGTSANEELSNSVRISDGRNVDFVAFRKDKEILESDSIPVATGDLKNAGLASVTFKKLSDDIDTKKISETLGKKVNYASYDNFLVNGIYKVSHVDSNPEGEEQVNPYVYFVFDIDAVAQTITQYYAYKADVTKKGDAYVLADGARKMSVPTKYSFRKTSDNRFTLSFNGETYSVFYDNGRISISSEANTLYETEATDPDALATEILDEYLSSKG